MQEVDLARSVGVIGAGAELVAVDSQNNVQIQNCERPVFYKPESNVMRCERQICVASQFEFLLFTRASQGFYQ